MAGDINSLNLLVFFSNTCNVIVMITENILAVIIITFKYFSNTFGY